MADAVTSYVIDTYPEICSIPFPRLYRVVSIDGAEVARYDVAFDEVATVSPEVSGQYVTAFKEFLSAFNETLDPAIGVADFNEPDFISLGNAVAYITSRIPNPIEY